MHTDLQSYQDLFRVAPRYRALVDRLAANGWELHGDLRADYEMDPYSKSYSAHKFYQHNGHINAVTVTLIPCRYFPLPQDINLLAVDEYKAINLGSGYIDPDTNARFESHEVLRLDMNNVEVYIFDKIIARYSNVAQVDLRPKDVFNSGGYGIDLFYKQYLGKDVFEYLTEDGMSIHRNLNTLEYASYDRKDLFS